jgi:proline iminopeptidase
MQQDKGTIEADGFHLRYQIEGDGPPAIVIGSALFYPRAFSGHLREHLMMAFLDHRGFAPVPDVVSPRSFELTTIADDIERARQALRLERIAIFGHSGHAYMALEYAKKYPQHVSHVVMIGIAPDLSPQSTQLAERYWQESVCPERKATLEDNLRRLPDEQLAGLSPSARFVKTYVRSGPRIWYDPHYDCSPLWDGVEPNEVLFRIWGEVFSKIDITQGLDALDQPVFLAVGRYDFLVAPPSSWDPVRPHFRDLTMRVFERSGHTPQYEEPELFDNELLTWMRKYK